MAVIARCIEGRVALHLKEDVARRDVLKDENARNTYALASFWVTAPTADEAAAYRDGVLSGRLFQSAVAFVRKKVVGWSEFKSRDGQPVVWKDGPGFDSVEFMAMDWITELAEGIYKLANPDPEDFG